MRKAGGERRPGRVRGCSSAGTRGWKERLSQTPRSPFPEPELFVSVVIK